MLDGIGAAEMLRGRARRAAGRPRGARRHDRRVSELVTDFPEIAEVDLNPVLATPEGAIAVDVRVILDRPRAATEPAGSPARRSWPR